MGYDDGFYHGYDENSGGGADDGFYHGYEESSSVSDELNRKAEYDAKVSQIMAGYNSEKRKQDDPLDAETIGIMMTGHRSSPRSRSRSWRGSSPQTFDEMSPEAFEAKKAEYLAKADEIQYNRSMGSGYSNGGSSQYEFVGDRPDSPFQPKKQVAALQDGKNYYFLPLVIGTIVLVMFILALAGGIINNVKSKDFIANADTVTGLVSRVSSGTRNSSSYHVYYKYEYNGTEYNGSQSLDFGQANRLGLVKFAVVNKAVKVYVDPENPQYSLIDEKPMLSGAAIVIVSIIGLGFLVYGIVMFSLFKNGKMVTYYKNGKKICEKL